MTKRRSLGANRVALGGILAALSVATVFLASFVPGIELTLFALSSLYVLLFLAEAGLAAGLVFYLATSLLAFLILPTKLSLIPYPLFFGLYPLFKPSLDRLKHPVGRIAVKLCLFNLLWAIGYGLLRQLVLGTIRLPDFPWWLLLLGAQFLFLLYDAILSGLAEYVGRRLKPSGENR